MGTMDPVVHFEMPAKNKKRASDFYTNAFGWKMTLLGEGMGNYLLAETTEVNENRMPKKVGAINGGFFDYQEKVGFNMPHLVISVVNIEKAIERVKKAGGKIIGGASGEGKIDDIPGIGRYISFMDSEGNIVGILEPLPRK